MSAEVPSAHGDRRPISASHAIIASLLIGLVAGLVAELLRPLVFGDDPEAPMGMCIVINLAMAAYCAARLFDRARALPWPIYALMIAFELFIAGMLTTTLF